MKLTRRGGSLFISLFQLPLRSTSSNLSSKFKRSTGRRSQMDTAPLRTTGQDGCSVSYGRMQFLVHSIDRNWFGSGKPNAPYERKIWVRITRAIWPNWQKSPIGRSDMRIVHTVQGLTSSNELSSYFVSSDFFLMDGKTRNKINKRKINWTHIVAAICRSEDIIDCLTSVRYVRSRYYLMPSQRILQRRGKRQYQRCPYIYTDIFTT